MESEIIVALFSLAGTCFGSIVGIFTSNKLVNYRIEQLEKKVDKHNNVIERMAIVENDIETIKTELKRRCLEMMEEIMEVIQSNIIEIIGAILVGIASFIGTKIKTIYEEKANDETKRKIVKTVVEAIEQIYSDLDGATKFQKAQENIVAMLNEKGITITELEINMLIESVVNGFNSGIKKEGDKNGKNGKGIDISTHQGFLNENAWKKIKRSGIEFAILRVGFTGYGKAKSKQKDDQFENNYAMAKKVGIPVGVYWYSCAVTESEAIEEANHVLQYIKGKQFEFPIYIDTEDNHDTSKYSPTSQVSIGKNALTKVVKAFCEKIEGAGYYVGIYASTSWFNSRLNDAELSAYDHWIAQWSSAQPTKPHGVWQYTSSGKVNGIKGNVDMNFAYRNYMDIMKKSGLNGFSKVENSVKLPEIEEKPTIQEKAWKNYTIQKGDTLSAIAERFGTTVDELVNKNNIKNANLIYAGTTISVPSDKESNEIVYVVKKGDNLSKIAEQYNTTWQNIYEKNKNTIGNNPNIIRAGQKLII